MRTRVSGLRRPAVTLFLILIACGGHAPARYESPPILANREEITDALRAVGAGLEARVVLLVRVDEEGRVQSVRVAQGSGVESLDDAALWIGERMRFVPARYQGEPVAALIRVPVTFDVVTQVVRKVRLRNAEEIVGRMIREHGDVRGTARFRVRVGPEGWPREVRDRGASDTEAVRAARPFIDDLDFRPAYKSDRPVASWIDLTFVFAGPQSQVFIEGEEGT